MYSKHPKTHNGTKGAVIIKITSSVLSGETHKPFQQVAVIIKISFSVLSGETHKPRHQKAMRIHVNNQHPVVVVVVSLFRRAVLIDKTMTRVWTVISTNISIWYTK